MSSGRLYNTANAATGKHSIQIARPPGQKLGLDLLDKKGEVIVSRVHDGYAADASAQVFAGDVIVSGTPGGVGDKRDPPVYMVPGDTVEVEIGALGILRNPVVAETAA